MVLARRLTRGLGERTQIKEIRVSQYPQTGLKESIIPSPQNLSVSRINVTAIRVNNHCDPSMINSWRGAFNNGTNFVLMPFLGIVKGTNNYGLSYEHWRPELNTGNVITGVTLVHTQKRRIPLIVSTNHINSFGTTPFALRPYNNIVFSNNNFNGILLDRFGTLSNSFIFKNQEGRFRQDLIVTDKMQGIKGGTSNHVVINKNRNQWHRIEFNRKFNQSFTVDPYIEKFSLDLNFYNDLRLSNVELYGTLSYFGANTNQNNNAAWLLNQRTQYHRKFNQLKTLGV